MLATFVPEHWPGRTGEDRYSTWKQARRAWHEEHGWPAVRLLSYEASATHAAAAAGQTLLSWGRTPEELARLHGKDYGRPRC